MWLGCGGVRSGAGADMAASTDTSTSLHLMVYFWEPDPVVSQISLLFLNGNLHIT